jgi:hypothetical protein
MTNSNWQGQVLRRYLPNYTTEEMEVEISKEFIGWHDAHKKNEELKDILAEVRRLKSENDKENLIHHILAVCFLASLDDSYDACKTSLDEVKNLNKNINKQRRPLEELSILLEGCIKNPMMIAKFVEYEQNQKPMPFQKEVGLIPPEHLKVVLDAYIERINNVFGSNLKESNDNNHPLLRNSMRVLVFNENIPHNKYRVDSRQNPLCYNLTFLFRHFTQKKKGAWLPYTNGSMPEEGISHYALVASLANIIFRSTDGNELDTENVQDKVTLLIENEVRLGNWISGSIG